MHALLKLGAFTIGLAAVFGVAVGAGRLVGPVETVADTGHTVPRDPVDHAAHEPRGSGTAASTDAVPGGLMVADRGHTLALSRRVLPSDPRARLSFRILDQEGRAVTDYETRHAKQLHLIVVRRDLSGYQHLHPTRDTRGLWSTRADLAAAGEYRVFADFVPAGEGGLTLGTDLSVPGDYEPRPLPAPARTASVGAYDVTLTGRLVPGTESPVTLTVARNGRPVRDLEPYLGANGHLVALRDGDLGYLHVHPTSSGGAGSDVGFLAKVPSAGRYRLFLDFKHDRVVRTAELTAVARTGAAPAGAQPPPSTAGHGTGSQHGH